jgi:S-formylglutathione hydrolase
VTRYAASGDGMWTTTTIGGRPADVFTPADRPRSVLLFLPDLDGQTLRDNAVWTDLLNRDRLACVCPDGGESWWGDKICPSFNAVQSGERYFLDEVVPWAVNQFRVPANAMALAGIGAGGQGALRFAFKYPDRFRTVATLNAAIDHYELYGRGTCLDEMYPSREHCRQDGVILHVHPSNWPPYVWFACDPESPWLRGNDRLHEKLMALGTPHTFDFTTQVCGHSWIYYDHLAPAMLRFVVESLEKESRRLL